MTRRLDTFLSVCTLLVAIAVPVSVYANSAGSGWVKWGVIPGTGFSADVFLFSQEQEFWGSNGGDVMNSGYIKTLNSGTNSPISFSTGWLAVWITGYRDGGYCGDSGWHYNRWADYSFVWNADLCTDPAGIQSFQTQVWGAAFDGSVWRTYGPQSDPIGSY